MSLDPNNKSVLRKALGKKIGSAESPFFTPKSKIFDGVRKAYSKAGMQNALKRKVQNMAKKRLIARGKKMAAKAWIKLVPGLNVISGIADVIGTGMDVYDIGKVIMSSDTVIKNAIKVVPDFAVSGPDGVLEKIYDFKFDDPVNGYKDEWQTTNKQEAAYNEALGGKKPIKVDNKTCECDKKKPGKRIPNV